MSDPVLSAAMQADSADDGTEWLTFRDLIDEGVDAVDWEGSGLPPHYFDPNIEPIPPREMAEGLVGFAFEDALEIIDVAERSIAVQQPDAPPLELLLGSRHNLLQIALLPDADKAELLRAIERADLRPRVQEWPQFTGHPLVIKRDETGQETLDWRPEIKEWIASKTMSGRGCPAHRKIVTDGEKKTTLLYFFWDRLVRSIYQQSPVS